MPRDAKRAARSPVLNLESRQKAKYWKPVCWVVVVGAEMVGGVSAGVDGDWADAPDGRQNHAATKKTARRTR